MLATLQPPTPRSRRLRRKRMRRAVSPTLPLEPVDMDLSVEKGPNHRLFKTFRKVWDDSHSEKYQNNLLVQAHLPSLLNRRLTTCMRQSWTRQFQKLLIRKK